MALPTCSAVRNESPAVVSAAVWMHRRVRQVSRPTVTEGAMRAAAMTNRWGFDKNEASELYLIDPVAGVLQR